MAMLLAAALLLLGGYVQGMTYTVKVSASTQDVHVGSNVSLGCAIEPLPSEPCQYRWTFGGGGAGIERNRSANGSTLALTLISSQRVRYFCRVYSRGTFMASGSIVLQPKDMQPEASLDVPLQQQLYVLHQHVYVASSLTLDSTNVPQTFPIEDELKAAWYHEGSAVPMDGDRYTQSVDVLPDGTVSATLVIANGSPEDAGIYTVEAFVPADQLKARKPSIAQNDEYWKDLNQATGQERIILATSEVNLVLYEPPHVVLSANQTILGENENAVLSCSLVGGESRSGQSIIRWLKGGNVLNETRGTTSQLQTLQIKADHPVFGKYSCIVVDLHYAEEKSLVLSEEAFMEIQLKPLNHTVCTNWKGSDLQGIESEFVHVLADLMSKMSQNTITSDSIKSPSMTCARGGASLLFRGKLVYTNLKGDVTASSIVLRTMGIVNSTVVLGAHVYQISDPSNNDGSTDVSQVDEGLFVGRLAATLVSFAILGTIVITVIVVLRRHLFVSNSSKKRQGWIIMDSMENQ